MAASQEVKLAISTPEGERLIGVLALKPPKKSTLNGQGKQKLDLFVVLHGIFGHKDYLMLPEMASKLPVSSLRYDCQGCGESSGVDRNYGAYYADMVDLRFVIDLFESPAKYRSSSSSFPLSVISAPGYASPSIEDLFNSYDFQITGMIGHSKGAHIAFMHVGSIFKPELLDGLPVLPPSLGGYIPRKVHQHPKTTNVKYFVDLSTRFDMTTLRQRYGKEWPTAEKEGKFIVEVGLFRFDLGKVNEARPKGTRQKEPVYLEDLLEFMRIPMPDLARAIPSSIATLITHCEKDTLTTPWHSEQFHEAIPHSELFMLPGGDHNYSRPKELGTQVTDKICSWLAEKMGLSVEARM